MSDNNESIFGLDADEQEQLFEQLETAKLQDKAQPLRQRANSSIVPESFGLFSELPEYKQIKIQLIIAEKMGLRDLFLACHETKAGRTSHIRGEEFLNFATYDYLGLNGHPELNAAAVEALEKFGTSAGASRLVAGERPQHALLENAVVEVFGTEAAVAFVSGHATNVSAIATIIGPKDAIFHDALAHNSIITGALLSGADRFSYPHNNVEALERLLRFHRSKYERVIIATEGLFSMDGSILRLPEMVALKRAYTCFLLVDEAHSIGVLGKTGRGVAEHFGIPHTDVDIWMGTLSKTMCGCGGFIAGSNELITLLKFRASGFVYSVGMPPPIAAASAKAIEIMLREPERTARIQDLSAFCLAEAKNRGLNTGYAEGYAIIPIIVGNSLVAGTLSAALFQRKISALPIIHPVVEEGMARIRLFISYQHTKEDIIKTLDAIVEELPKALSKME